jgi:hypothetical protein
VQGGKEVVRRFWVVNKRVVEKVWKEGTKERRNESRKVLIKERKLNMIWKMYMALFSRLKLF